MSAELLERIVELLERIESKLDALDRVSDHADAASSTLSSIQLNAENAQQYLSDLKLDACGCEHEGRHIPGYLERIAEGVERLESAIASLDSNR